MECPMVLDDMKRSVPKKESQKPWSSVRYQFVWLKKLKEMLNEKLGACNGEKIVEQSPKLGQTMDDRSKEQSMWFSDDTVCSVPQKPSPKSQTSVRRKKVKEMMIEKSSACSCETIAEQSPELGQRLEDRCKDEQVMWCHCA